MKKKYRRLFHDHGVHDYCVIVQEKEVVGHDYSPQYLSGLPNEDGTREFFEVTTFGGRPVYSGKTIEAHNP